MGQELVPGYEGTGRQGTEDDRPVEGHRDVDRGPVMQREIVPDEHREGTHAEQHGKHQTRSHDGFEEVEGAGDHAMRDRRQRDDKGAERDETRQAQHARVGEVRRGGTDERRGHDRDRELRRQRVAEPLPDPGATTASDREAKHHRASAATLVAADAVRAQATPRMPNCRAKASPGMRTTHDTASAIVPAPGRPIPRAPSESTRRIPMNNPPTSRTRATPTAPSNSSPRKNGSRVGDGEDQDGDERGAHAPAQEREAPHDGSSPALVGLGGDLGIGDHPDALGHELREVGEGGRADVETQGRRGEKEADDRLVQAERLEGRRRSKQPLATEPDEVSDCRGVIGAGRNARRRRTTRQAHPIVAAAAITVPAV